MNSEIDIKCKYAKTCRGRDGYSELCSDDQIAKICCFSYQKFQEKSTETKFPERLNLTIPRAYKKSLLEKLTEVGIKIIGKLDPDASTLVIEKNRQ